jgi:sigma-E factor negative regulatory protein RseC
MIEESGRVVAVDGHEVWIETIRKSACSGCSARSGCGQGVLSKLGNNQRGHIRLHTDLGLQVGDEVVLGLPEQAFIRSSFLAYGLPLVVLIAMVLVADKLLALAEPWVILSAIVGLGVGFAVVRLLSRLAEHRADFQPVIVRAIPAVDAD